MTPEADMREGHFLEELERLHQALAEQLRIPEWILYGFSSEAEWLLVSLFMSMEEMQDMTRKERGVAFRALRDSFRVE